MAENKNTSTINNRELILLHNKSVERCCAGDYDGVLKFSLKAIEILNEIGLVKSEECAKEAFMIGYAYDKLEQYSKALDYYKLSRDLFNKLDIAVIYEQLANVHNNIGIILANNGKFDAAIRNFTISGNIIANNKGRHNEDYANSLYSCAAVYFMKRDYTRAAMLFTESMKTFQLRGIELIDTFCALGYCLEMLSGPSQAAGCFDNALLLMSHMPENYPRERYAIQLYTANIRLKEGNLQTAERLLKEACEEIPKTLGVQNLQYVKCADTLSRIYAETDTAKAIMYKKAALAAIEKITSHGSFLYTDTANELAALYRNSGQFEKAMDIISEYMRRAEEDGNTDTDGYVKNALIQADILRKQNKEKDAIKILEHIVFDCSNKHDDYVKCLLMLVHLYLQYGYGKSLYGVYNEFVKVKPGNSFDDMLDMSEDF